MQLPATHRKRFKSLGADRMRLRIFLLAFLPLLCHAPLPCNGMELLQNGELKTDDGGKIRHWNMLDKQCRYFVENGHVGGGTLENRKAPDFAIFQEISFPEPDRSPLVLRGESCSVNAGYGGDYCIYADVYHTDGTVRYSIKAKWRPGTHPWEETAICHEPDKPVSKVIVYVLLRNSTGKALFRNITLSRKPPGPLMNYCSLLALAPFRPDHYRLDLGFFNDRTLFTGAFLDKEGKKIGDFSGNGKVFRQEFKLPRHPYKIDLHLNSDGKSSRTARTLATLPEHRFLTDKHKVAVWCANAMEKISPLTFPGKDSKRQALLELAGNERESMQIVISNSTPDKLYGINCHVNDFIDAEGRKFPGKIEFRRIAYLPRTIPYGTHPEQLPEHEYWLPDPLLPMRDLTIPGQGSSGIWMTVYAPRGTPRGIYNGKITVTGRKKELGHINVRIRVFGFDLPQTFTFRSAFSLMDGFMERYYPEKTERFRRQAWDLMLDHRLNPDDITRTDMPAIEDLLYARSRGMNSFNILHLVPRPRKKVLWTLWAPLSAYNEKLFAEFAFRLDDYIAELEKYDLKKFAYFYGFDERRKDAFDALKRTRDFVKKRWNIPLMSTSTMFQELVRQPENPAYMATDWFCPLTNFYNPALAERLRKKGHQIWVYSCCGPEYPYVNFSNLEYPFMNARQMAWQVYALRADGFLFWHVNNWKREKRMYIDDTVNFQRFYLREKFAMNTTGDGEFLYPGKNEIYPSIRLANLRDGSEDYDYLVLLSRKDPALALDFSKRICPQRRSPVRDFRKLLEIRREIAEHLENEKQASEN